MSTATEAPTQEKAPSLNAPVEQGGIFKAMEAAQAAAAKAEANQVKAEPEIKNPGQAEPAKEAPKVDTPEKPEKKAIKVDKTNPMSALRAVGQEVGEVGEVDEVAIEKEIDAEFDDQNKPGGWKSLKGKLKSKTAQAQQYERSIAQLKQELEASKASTVSAPNEEIESFKARIKELEDGNAIVAWQSSPEYKNGIQKPLQEAYNFLGAIAQEYELPNHEINGILGMTDRAKRNAAIDKLLENASLTPTNQKDFMDAIQSAIQLQAKEKEGYDKANDLYQATLQNRNAESESATKQRLAEYDAAEKGIFTQLSGASIISDYMSGDVGKESREYAKQKHSPQEQAYNAHAGYLLPHLQDEITNLRAEVASYKETVAKYSKGTATAGAGSAATTTQEREEKPSLKNAGMGIAAAMQSRGLR